MFPGKFFPSSKIWNKSLKASLLSNAMLYAITDQFVLRQPLKEMCNHSKKIHGFRHLGTEIGWNCRTVSCRCRALSRRREWSVAGGGGGGGGRSDVDDGVADVLVAHETSDCFLTRLRHRNAIARAVKSMNANQHDDLRRSEQTKQQPDHEVDYRDRQVGFLVDAGERRGGDRWEMLYMWP